MALHPRQLSPLCVTMQTEENDSFHHFLLNDSVLIQHLLATSFAPVSHFISNCQALGQPL